MLKLLIVDDEKWTRDGLKKCIPWSSLGIKDIKEAEDGRSGIEVALSFQPDIILSDIRMPKMTGIEFVTYIRKELPDSKIIFLSGYSDKEYLKSAIQLKAISYVEKPINSSELICAVRAAVDECLKEKEQSRSLDDSTKRLHKSLPIIKQELALKLIENKKSPEELSSLISLSGENLPVKGNYLTILYKLNPRQGCLPEELEAVKQNMLKIVREAYLLESLSHITGIKDHIYILSHVLLSSGHNSQSLRKVTDKIRCKFMESMEPGKFDKNILFIAIGLSVYSIDKIYSSYQSAFSTVQKIFFYGKYYTVVYEEKDECPYIFNSDLEQFEKFIISNDKQKFYSLVNSTIDDIMRHDSTLIDNIKNFFYNLLLRIKSIAQQNGIRLFNGSDEIDYLWKLVSNALTLKELSECLLGAAEYYFTSIEEKTGSNRTVYRIKNFIQTNYTSRNLSVFYISEQLSLTPAYICQIFKNEMGITIHDYINDVRINKAKELLRDCNAKVFEVALSCGYNEDKYFTRVFKAMTGKTPSQFRKEIKE